MRRPQLRSIRSTGLVLGIQFRKRIAWSRGGAVDTMDYRATLALRDRVLQGIVANNADINLVKTHNINQPAFGTVLIPERFTRSAIYIMRNPMDMVLSYARHYGMSLDETISAVSRSDHVNEPDDTTVFQFLGSWSDHVESWTKPSPFPNLCLAIRRLAVRSTRVLYKGFGEYWRFPLSRSVWTGPFKTPASRKFLSRRRKRALLKGRVTVRRFSQKGRAETGKMN